MTKPIASYFERMGLTVSSSEADEGRPYNTIFIRNVFDYQTAFRYLPTAFDDEPFWEVIHYKIQNLLYKRVLFPDQVFTSPEEFAAFVHAHHPTLTPQEKLDAVLEYIHSKTEFDGQKLYIYYSDLEYEDAFRALYLKNAGELVYYLQMLREDGYLSFPEDHQLLNGAFITIKGLNKLLTIQEKKNSRICFVAMSFSPELENVYTHAIAPAITENGFVPLLLRDQQLEADKTINDAILAGLKKARFTLADFTGHRANVYFEAGFALGRGQKVIYSCKADQLDEAHFDTRNFQHLVWKDEEDFRKKLSDKIQAYIMD
jgi:hypothetical protein